MFSIKGETVLDPFLGSGTTTNAALANDRNSIGYEVDAKLLQTIRKKVDAAKMIHTLEIVDRGKTKQG
jgi:DNA modification methylase